MNRCVCGKVVFNGAAVAIKEAQKMSSKAPLWVYQCKQGGKGDFHITRRHGAKKYKVQTLGI